MKTLIYYEKRKILRRKSTIIACLLMLLSIIALSFVFVSDQDYYRTDGTEVSGMEAIHVKQEMDHALAGPLTAKRLKDTLQQYHTVYGNSDNFGTSGALKDEVYCKDILPYNGILNLMRRIYSPAGAYDMNILSSITNERVENFYQDRHAQVQSIVDMDYTTGNYTQAEKDTILKLDAKVSDPITYDYSDGWKTLLTRDFPTVFLLIALVVCIIISPVFAYEYQTGADAVVLSSKYGRRETVWAKLIAGFAVTSRIYFIAVLVSLISVLAVFGVQGWNCDFQILSTTAYYGLKIWQVVFVGIVDDDGRATKVVARKSGPACQRVRRHHADTHAEGQACSRYQVEGARFLYERGERRVVVIEHDVGRAIDDGLEDGIPVIVLDESKGHG